MTDSDRQAIREAELVERIVCDVCYWRKRAEEGEAEIARLRELVVSECARGFLEGARAARRPA